MNRARILTIRMPVELKTRLELQARYQGVSLNQLTNYFINNELNQLEVMRHLEKRLSGRNIQRLKTDVQSILDKVSCRNIPEWDKI